MLAHAYCFSLREPERRRRMVERYLDLTTRVPVFEIRVESGLERPRDSRRNRASAQLNGAIGSAAFQDTLVGG